jgi:hypothetical protein
MIIRIARLGTGIKEVHLNPGCVDDALAASRLSVESFQIRVGGQIVSGSHPLQDGDIITLVLAGGIKGAYDVPVANGPWRVHQNDPDDIFPSDFHAHNIARAETLDIYTGNVYNPVTKQLTRRLSKKHFRQFHRALPERLKR